ncbi:MAG: glycosyltransferase [Acidimicrobiales bacterium]|jgi:glycosyltransferase involved in cell wall biosynthesis
MDSTGAGTVGEDDRATPTTSPGPAVEIVLPVFDEERRLEEGVRGLHAYLATATLGDVVVTIADNGSTDRTGSIGRHLVAALPGIRMVRLEEKGRGRALRAVWSESSAAVVAYMDIDLSTGLDAFPPLVQPLLDGVADVAVGTRLAPGSRVDRSLVREVLSRGYNGLVQGLLRSRVSDAQCGFKAVRREVLPPLLSRIVDDAWFFDTELVVTAERLGLRIEQVPVTWVENSDSRVHLLRTSLRDLQGIARLLRTPAPVGMTVAPGPSADRPDDHIAEVTTERTPTPPSTGRPTCPRT